MVLYVYDLQLSWKYFGYFLMQNVVSWNFRSLGFIISKPKIHVLYSAYYSESYNDASITFILSGLFWMLLIWGFLKRKSRSQNPNGPKVMVLRCGGMHIHMHFFYISFSIVC